MLSSAARPPPLADAYCRSRSRNGRHEYSPCSGDSQRFIACASQAGCDFPLAICRCQQLARNFSSNAANGHWAPARSSGMLDHCRLYLQHRIGIAGVAEVLQPKVALALRQAGLQAAGGVAHPLDPTLPVLLTSVCPCMQRGVTSAACCSYSTPQLQGPTRRLCGPPHAAGGPGMHAPPTQHAASPAAGTPGMQNSREPSPNF